MNRLTVNLKKQYDDYCLSLPCYQGVENAKNYISPYKENLYLPDKNVTKQECYNKLGYFEDFEDNLGCPLDVLTKALKVGIVIIDETGFFNIDALPEKDFNEYKRTNKEYFDVRLRYYMDEFILIEEYSPCGEIEFGIYGCRVKTNDYKKTWILKEE